MANRWKPSLALAGAGLEGRWGTPGENATMCSDIADREVNHDAVTPGDRAAHVGHESGLEAHAGE